MQLTELARGGKGNLKAGHWSREVTKTPDENVQYVRIYHYSTMMLNYKEIVTGEGDVVKTKVMVQSHSTGNGSKSDQGGLNILFRTLKLPYYYSRQGGAQIIDLDNERV